MGIAKQTYPFLLAEFLIITLLVSCSRLMSESQNDFANTSNSYKAVYLASGEGTLLENDLQAHPEIIRVATFEEFKEQAGDRIVLWVDKDAIPLVDMDWLNAPPQKYYPLAVIGYNNAVYCFRDTLSVGLIQGPYVDWSKETVEPGFCVWMIRTERSDGLSAFMNGYQQTPNVQDILNATNPLLEEPQDIQGKQ